MKKHLLAALAAMLLLTQCTREPVADIPRIILDTDIGPDYDDVGAITVLHAMADSGRAEILATVSCNLDSLTAPCLDVLNTWFGRPNLPIGAPKSGGVKLGAFQHWPDSLTARYPHRLKSTADAPDAVQVYRRILSAQPDTSVTIVSVGFFTNLANLLKSQPDSLSDLNGTDLVARKVKQLVSMAGGFPQGNEFNVHMDSTASVYVFTHWPTPVILSGFEIGREIHTGLRVRQMKPGTSPVSDVFRISIPLAAEDSLGRMSWDETAVLIGVYGTKGFFDTVRGTMTVHADGSNGWTNDPAGRHRYVVQKMSPAETAAFIEDRMMHLPMTQPQTR
jgi:inosine-uridine nucleoside N-ribohydrolase